MERGQLHKNEDDPLVEFLCRIGEMAVDGAIAGFSSAIVIFGETSAGVTGSMLAGGVWGGAVGAIYATVRHTIERPQS